MSANKNTVQTVLPIQAFPTQDINGATLGEDYVSTKNYEMIEVEISVGNVAGNFAVTLKQATAVAGTAEKALGFDYYWVGGVKTTATSDTFTILAASDDNKIFVIPIAASELDVAGGFDCLRVDLADPSAAALVAATYHCGGARFAGASLPSAIID